MVKDREVWCATVHGVARVRHDLAIELNWKLPTRVRPHAPSPSLRDQASEWQSIWWGGCLMRGWSLGHCSPVSLMGPGMKVEQFCRWDEYKAWKTAPESYPSSFWMWLRLHLLSILTIPEQFPARAPPSQGTRRNLEKDESLVSGRASLGTHPPGLPHTPLYKLSLLTSLTVETAWENGSM